jgi:folate-dependent phosphoribosylglycinamide formyltransferase PurN
MLTNCRPLRAAVLCSKRAPGLVDLLEHDRRRGEAYEIVCVVCSEAAFAEERRLAELGVRVLSHPIAGFCAQRGASMFRDFDTRAHYDAATLGCLRRYAPDLILLDGYRYLVTRPLLDAFPARILNLHFSDLTVRTADGRPMYPGPRAVRDAIVDAQTETSATVHLVNDVPDGGAPIVRSWAYPVSPLAARARAWQAADMLKAYAFAHQEWMIRGASALLLAASLALIADGRVDLDALAEADPAASMPWLVDEQGRLAPPASSGMCERLWRYRR